jgi:hypothetical protein
VAIANFVVGDQDNRHPLCIATSFNGLSGLFQRTENDGIAFSPVVSDEDKTVLVALGSTQFEPQWNTEDRHAVIFAVARFIRTAGPRGESRVLGSACRKADVLGTGGLCYQVHLALEHGHGGGRRRGRRTREPGRDQIGQSAEEGQGEDRGGLVPTLTFLVQQGYMHGQEALAYE